MRKLTIATALALIFVPALVFGEPKTFKELIGMIIDLVNRATSVLVLAAVVIFLYGTAYNLFRSNEHGGAQLRNFMVWGVIALFVMVSVWGILNLIATTFLGGSAGANSAQYDDDF